MDIKNRLTAFLIVLLLPFVADADWFDDAVTRAVYIANMGAMIERVKTAAMVKITEAIPADDLADHVRIAAYGWVSMVEELF